MRKINCLRIRRAYQCLLQGKREKVREKSKWSSSGREKTRKRVIYTQRDGGGGAESKRDGKRW